MILALLWVLLFGCAAAVVDARTHRLPNQLTGLAYAGAALTVTVRGILGWSAHQLAVPLAGGLILAGSYLTVSVVTHGGLGLGDVKLAAAIGTGLGTVGLSLLLTATFISTISASLAVLTNRALRRSVRRHELAFGPHMMLGYALTLLVAA